MSDNLMELARDLTRQEEITRLRAENAELRAENEDLRAALKLLRDTVWRYDSTQGGMRMNEDGEYVRWDVVDEICRQVMPGEEG